MDGMGPRTRGFRPTVPASAPVAGATELRVEWIRSLPELERIGAAWRDLDARIGPARGFNRWTWRRIVYEHLVAEGDSPLVGTAWRGTDLVAVAPFVAWRGPVAGVPLRRVEFAGHRAGDGEFLTILEPARTAELFVDSLLGLEACDAAGIFTGAPGTPEHEAILAVAGRRGWKVDARSRRYALVEMPGDYDAYLSGLSGKFRHNLRKRVRMMDEEGGWSVECVGAGASELDFHRAADRMFEISNRSWKVGRAGRMEERYMRLFRRIVVELSREGAIRFWLLRIGGRDAAYFLALQDGEILYDIAIGFDERFRALAPGVHLTQEVLRSFLDHGTHLLVSHGDHSYKEHWATGWRAGSHLQLFAPGLRGRLAHLLRSRLSPLFRRVRARRGRAPESDE